MNIRIPTWAEIDEKPEGERTALETFIHSWEPTGQEQETYFRYALSEMLEEVAIDAFHDAL